MGRRVPQADLGIHFGRRLKVVIELADAGSAITRGDHVRIDGTEYVVEGLGGMRVASEPEPLVGIWVKTSD